MSAMIKLFLGPLKKWAYSDFMQETAKPTRRAWVRIREAHMESLIKGVDWMEKNPGKCHSLPTCCAPRANMTSKEIHDHHFSMRK